MSPSDPNIDATAATGQFFSPLDLTFDPTERLALLDIEGDAG